MFCPCCIAVPLASPSTSLLGHPQVDGSDPVNELSSEDWLCQRLPESPQPATRTQCFVTLCRKGQLDSWTWSLRLLGMACEQKNLDSKANSRRQIASRHLIGSRAFPPQWIASSGAAESQKDIHDGGTCAQFFDVVPKHSRQSAGSGDLRQARGHETCES